MPTTTMTTCESCKHWNSKGSEGECRRHAPQTIVFELDSETRIESRFPTTQKDDWCGDHETC
ncbi:MAG: hypothetical protein AAGA18_12340 [Verrucomicrobiota bacterium]